MLEIAVGGGVHGHRLDPELLQARRMCRAISPRLAMTTLSNMGGDFPYSMMNSGSSNSTGRIAVFNQDRLDHAALSDSDLVYHFRPASTMPEVSPTLTC